MPVEVLMAKDTAGYTEGVSLAEVQPYTDNSCTSICEVLADQRRCNGVNFGTGLHPVTFTDSLYCYPPAEHVKRHQDRRFRTSVNCELIQRPRSYFETCYILPKRLATTFVSQLEYGAVKVTRRWYSSAIRFFQSRPSCSALSLTGSTSMFACSGPELDADFKNETTSDVFLPTDNVQSNEGRHCTVVEAAVGRCSLPSITPDSEGVLRLDLTADVNNNDGISAVRDATSYCIRQLGGAEGVWKQIDDRREEATRPGVHAASFRTTISVNSDARNTN